MRYLPFPADPPPGGVRLAWASWPELVDLVVQQLQQLVAIGAGVELQALVVVQLVMGQDLASGAQLVDVHCAPLRAHGCWRLGRLVTLASSAKASAAPGASWPPRSTCSTWPAVVGAW